MAMRENEPCVFFWNTHFRQCDVSFLRRHHGLLKELEGIWIMLNAGRNDDGLRVRGHFDVTLALLGETGHAMTDELMRSDPA